VEAGGRGEGMAAVAGKKGDTDLFNMKDLVKVGSLLSPAALSLLSRRSVSSLPPVVSSIHAHAFIV
jgi:hypothetical protein